MAKLRRPKKEEKISDRPESLLSLLKAGAQFSLMVLGIVGLATLIFSDEGWLVQLARKASNFDSFGSLMIIPLIIGAVFVLRIWFERTFGKSSAAVMGNIAMYAMMAVGLFFLVRLLTTGSLTG